MTKIKTILSLVAVAMIATACSSTSNVKLHENNAGGYLAPAGSPHYVAQGGTLYANDGTRWYALRSPEIDSGDVRGMRVVKPERWIVAGGSRATYYHRTASTFRNQDLRPVFIQQ